MSAEKLEGFLARLYTDAGFREAFLEDPAESARAAGLDAEDCEGLALIDRDGLEMAAHSYAHKRLHREAPALAAPAPASRLGRWWALVRGGLARRAAPGILAPAGAPGVVPSPRGDRRGN